MSLREETATGSLSELVRMGGYLIIGGAFLGFSAGLFLLFSGDLFSFFIRISQFEVMGYFFSVFVPSFAILTIIGYLFSTTFGLSKKANMSGLVPLCVLSLLAMVLSGISIFYLVSSLGGFLTLGVLIRAYTQPTFKTLAKKEAFFLVEIGAMFVASFSTLSLLLWLISNLFQTYALGFYRHYSPFSLLLVGVFSFLMFFAIPIWGHRGTNAGISGIIGLLMSTLSYLFVVQNQYALLNAPAYTSMFMLVLGTVSAMGGNLIYIDLFLSEPPEPGVPLSIRTSTLLWGGRYCPYCGSARVRLQDLCSDCGRSLMWTPYAPFCTSCGRLVPANAQTCPHCREGIINKEIHFHQLDSQEQAIAAKLIAESSKKKTLILNDLRQMAQRIKQTLRVGYRFFKRPRV